MQFGISIVSDRRNATFATTTVSRAPEPGARSAPQ
jgi:hypothetical protein